MIPSQAALTCPSFWDKSPPTPSVLLSSSSSVPCTASHTQPEPGGPQHPARACSDNRCAEGRFGGHRHLCWPRGPKSCGWDSEGHWWSVSAPSLRAQALPNVRVHCVFPPPSAERACPGQHTRGHWRGTYQRGVRWQRDPAFTSHCTLCLVPAVLEDAAHRWANETTLTSEDWQKKV